MPGPFKTLLDPMPRDRRARIRAATDTLEQEMELAGLRRALGLTQVELAEALGAELKLVACFGDREVEITQFRGPDRD